MGPGKEDIFEVGSEGLSVADVAANLALSPEQVIADLFMIGIMANVNQVRYTSCGHLHKRRTPADRQCRLTPSRAQSECAGPSCAKFVEGSPGFPRARMRLHAPLAALGCTHFSHNISMPGAY